MGDFDKVVLSVMIAANACCRGVCVVADAALSRDWTGFGAIKRAEGTTGQILPVFVSSLLPTLTMKDRRI